MSASKYITQTIVSIILFIGVLAGKAQTNVLLDSLTLDTLKAYTSLEEALKHPDAVVKLVLKKNKLKTIPPEVFTFTNLQYLDVSKNQITGIPPSISQLKNLQYFTIEKNKLESIPPQIGELTNLFYLNIGQNDIYGLPPEIGKLENLRYIDAWSNNLSRFPDEPSNLKKLKVFDLRSIIISHKEEKRLHGLLPNTKVDINAHCSCGD